MQEERDSSLYFFLLYFCIEKIAAIQQCRCSWASFLPASGHIWSPQISVGEVEGYFQSHGMSHGLPFLPDQLCRESGTRSHPCVALKISAVRWMGQEKHSRVSEHSIWKQENVSLCYCKLYSGDGSWRKGQGSLPITAVLVFSFLSFSSSFSFLFLLFPGQAAGRGVRSWQWHRKSPTNGWEGLTLCAWNPMVSEDEEKPSSQTQTDSQVFTLKRKSSTLSSKKWISAQFFLHPILPNIIWCPTGNGHWTGPTWSSWSWAIVGAHSPPWRTPQI